MKRAVAALGVGIALLVPALATGTHVRPIAATPIRVSLVPAYEQCVAPDRVHGPPLVYGSCSSPVQTSGYLTVGNQPSSLAQSVGSLRWKAQAGIPGPPEDEVVTFTVSFTDVRCKGSSGACAGPGADYAGSLEVRIPVQITDHYNGPSAGPFTEPGTMRRDFAISFPVTCTQTSDPSIGSTCSVTSLYLEIIYSGDPIKEGKRNVWESGQLKVFDGGADGDGSTTGDNTLFAVQGLFVP
jgi:hypothetical protein